MAGPSDPFTLLGLPRTFSLSPDVIHAAHLARAAATHPDVSSDADSTEAAAQQSAEVNRAKDELLSDEGRANALLALMGGPTKEQDKTLPPDFLMEMMDTREEIERAVRSKEPIAIARWTSWAHDRRQALSREVGEMFERLGVAPAPTELRAIRVRLNVWRYIERLIEQLQPDYHGLHDQPSP